MTVDVEPPGEGPVVTPAKRTRNQVQHLQRRRKGTNSLTFIGRVPPEILTANLNRKITKAQIGAQTGSTTPKRFGDKNFATIHIADSPTTPRQLTRSRPRPGITLQTSNLPSSTRYTAAERKRLASKGYY
jgi:hypothetical protein